MTAYTALILAGGRALRMQGRDKGLLPLAGRPLTAHALAALQAQSLPPQRILISANRHLDDYARFGFPVLPDSLPDFPGPLAGLLSAMQAEPGSRLLTVPCDAVRLPKELAQSLTDALANGHDVVSLRDDDGWQPGVLLARGGLQDSLSSYLREGGRSIRGWLQSLRHTTVYSAEPLPNLNTPAALATLAAHWPD
ncbi:molybdenum cofactor guanylyltransferase MobA [uncultured Aquitalea sp.]|uniref:molybdenum cofactor guanylyltransferase MobA n=1 Tax=uncultured Aquitalea sp. TaxID=540272 RepID=UPI0025FD7BFA|nr:molybdenum cofactor guanylyltransferase MobA [uncultured Aquitalea sp.]